MDLLQQNGIAPTSLKGSAVAMNYPDSAYRTSRAVDFLVKEVAFLRDE